MMLRRLASLGNTSTPAAGGTILAPHILQVRSYNSTAPLSSGPSRQQINYRGSARWLGIAELPPTWRTTSRSTAELLFKEAIHVDKYNKDYAAMFTKLAHLTNSVLLKKEGEPFRSGFERIALQSFVHHCRNPRYGYGFTSPMEVAAGGEDLLQVAEQALVSEEQAIASRAALAEDRAQRRVLFDGPTWWQELQAHTQYQHSSYA
jgi:hypothetical protein